MKCCNLNHHRAGQNVEINKARHFVSWCRYDMLPLWSEIGWDAKYGGYFEDLHLDGTPDRSMNRRVRVTSRQVYSFAHASLLGWVDGRKQIAQGIEWLLDKGRDPSKKSGFAHLVGDTGDILDGKHDLYDHAFHILGFSYAARATGDSQILALAKQTLDFVEEALGSKCDAGWLENDMGTLPRRQNPHMHMVEALIALHAASGDTAHLRRAAQIVALLADHWRDAASDTLLEYFDDDWNPVEPLTPEPGHMVEWTWLSHSLRRAGGKLPVDLAHWPDLARRLGASECGLLLDAIHTDGTPAAGTSRLWGQTEWVKSLCALHESGTKQIENRLERVVERIFRHYLILEPAGLWIDKVNSQGDPLSTRVPASIVYHLMSAAAEVQRVFLDQEQGSPSP